MKLERRYVKEPIALQQRDDNPKGSIGTLTGYIAVYESDSLDLGGFIENIAPGAFRESLDTNDVVALVNHDHSVVVGRMSAGTLRLNGDSRGLAFEIDLPDTQAARDLKTLVERGDLLGCSFGFTVGGEVWSQREDGKDFCLLTKIDLFEVSVGVTFPAYPETSMEMRDRLNQRRETLRARDLARINFKALA